ncbi:hypothetical protein B7463_g4119, partial [Scytalidium lignicola]
MRSFFFISLICGASIWGAAVRATPMVQKKDIGWIWSPPSFKSVQLAITWEEGNPNGNPRKVIKINGQMPGPTLIFDENDEVEITVHNYMPYNTTVHWHGMLQQGTPWSDGVPGLSQRPIEPGQSFAYKFVAYPAGTYWYHAHSRATLLDGLVGALWIKPNSQHATPWSLISSSNQEQKQIATAAASPQFVNIQDWTDFTSWDYLAAEEKSGLDLHCIDSLLINGKGSVYCPGVPYLESQLSPDLKNAFANRSLTDKGCFPFVPATEDIYLPGNPSKIPPHLYSGCIPTSGSKETFSVNPSTGWVSFNIIMAATFHAALFSIDNHDLWVYELDGLYIKPQKVQVIEIFPGARYAVIVKLNQAPGKYTIRIADAGASQVISAFATLEYRGARGAGGANATAMIDYGGNIRSAAANVFNPSTPPLQYPNGPPAQTADTENVLGMGRYHKAWAWTVSGKEIYPQDDSAYFPLLFHPHSPPAYDSKLVVRTNNGTWVDIVYVVAPTLSGVPAPPHAIHKHSSKVYVIGSGQGTWDWGSVEEAIAAAPGQFNLVDPPYRDTVATPRPTGSGDQGGTWTVVRYQVTNPGPWLLHCHIEMHLAGGMAIAMMDGVDKWPTAPLEYALQAGVL